MVLNIMALMMLIFVASCVIYILALLGGLPGRISRQRQHPQADAINVMGWLGLLTGGVLWVVALIWAYFIPKPATIQSPSGTPESTAAAD